ncbi:ABC transporter permease [Marasmitruncus massiliensis]|uniref:ABC transporter permease n=1 Tax=Marasmitruncus massiliensis TaxID=1944642 RepID=UPI000C7CA699|nr:ABC transporter permease [Marasmitruncus massiliensis]MBE6906415.1 ABC transporter permease [Oscillospiraceae bacterium]
MQVSKRFCLKIVSALSILLFLLIWYLTTDVLKTVPPTSLPSPIKVCQTFVEKLHNTAPDGATLGVHILASLQVSLTGFTLGCVIGIPLGIFMAWFHRFDLLTKPVFDFLRTIPPIAFIPIMIILLGIGVLAKASIVFLSAFIPCVINTYTGIKATKPVHIWVAQTFGASRMRTLWKVAVPTALPFIFTGMKVSLNAAWTSLLAAEMLGSSKGLGFMIQMGRLLIRADVVVVGMITIGFIGFILSAILDYLETTFVKGGA